MYLPLRSSCFLSFILTSAGTVCSPAKLCFDYKLYSSVGDVAAPTRRSGLQGFLISDRRVVI
jgi:hypothetical protein